MLLRQGFGVDQTAYQKLAKYERVSLILKFLGGELIYIIEKVPVDK